MDELEPETLKVCEACGGAELKNACGFCFGLGLMDQRQVKLWRRWRAMQRKESSTHNMVRVIIASVLNRLRDSRLDGAQELRLEGEALLAVWERAGDDSRQQAAADLMSYHRRALELLAQ